MTNNELSWLMDEEYVPEVIVHTNREDDKLRFDSYLLESYGYKKNDTIIYRFKQGHSTLLSNPYMDGK